jgi:hypothetical protein
MKAVTLLLLFLAVSTVPPMENWALSPGFVSVAEARDKDDKDKKDKDDGDKEDKDDKDKDKDKDKDPKDPPTVPEPSTALQYGAGVLALLGIAFWLTQKSRKA